MLILSRWVNLVPLCVNRIVPRRSSWGATSVEDLTSALYRWVGDCRSTTSWGVVGCRRGWVLFSDLLMLIVLDTCDCCAVLSWRGDSVGWLFVSVGFCFVHVFRVIFCHRIHDFFESIR
jgi:hypothetical protein